MHLKNFSLYQHDNEIRLTPAYDLLNASIVNPNDNEELALTLNGRKKKLKKEDFIQAGNTMGIETKVISNLFNKYIKLRPKYEEAILNSFLNEELKAQYISLLKERISRLL